MIRIRNDSILFEKYKVGRMRREKLINEQSEDRSYYADRVRSDLISIIMDEGGVSEKSFDDVESITGEVDILIAKEKVITIIEAFESKTERHQYCAETIYSQLDWDDSDDDEEDDEGYEEEIDVDEEDEETEE